MSFAQARLQHQAVTFPAPESDPFVRKVTGRFMPRHDGELGASRHAANHKLAVLIRHSIVGMSHHPNHGRHPRVKSTGQVDWFVASAAEFDDLLAPWSQQRIAATD